MPNEESSKPKKSIVDEILASEYVSEGFRATARQVKTIATENEFRRRLKAHGESKVERKEKQEPFTHSPDFSTVVLDGISHMLTQRQALVVRLLYEEYQRSGGNGIVSKQYLLDALEDAYKYMPDRIQDLFRANKDAYKHLIQYVNKPRGSYRLNI